jgi:glycosyltransferase involved in cell wall biosynthesis
MSGISAVVATLKRKEELKRLFDTLILQEIPLLEVIVVDQNEDGLLDDLIAEYRSRLDIRHLRMEESNQSKARNFGARQARYSIICFPDDDCWFEAGSLPAVERHFTQQPQTDLLVINWRQNPNVHNTSMPLTKKEIYSFRSVGYVTYVLFFKKEVFERLGGFIENIGIGQYIGGGEDSELTFRAAKLGLNIFYESTIIVNHKYISIHSREHSVIRARQRGMGMVYAKYDVPFSVFFRGMVAPLVRMVMAMDGKKSGEYYNIFRGRLEGYVHTRKQLEKVA